jgi:DNA-binding Lrp family transcriptional regulator
MEKPLSRGVPWGKGGFVMTISAYVFIECTAGAAREVANEVGRISGVKRSNATTGPYDVIALVEASDVNVLGDFIVSKIQNISGVLRTQTNVIVD